jgi:LPS export ABC transporter protein LptC
MKKLSILFWIICVSSFLVLGCSKKEKIIYFPVDENIPDQESRNITITSTKGKLLEYKLKANYMQKYANKNLTLADTVEITSYNKKGEIQTILTCDKAELNDMDNTFIGTGNVVVTTENAILKTEYLNWDRNTNQFYAKNGVEILRDDNVMYGEEMRSDEKMTKIEITKVSAEGKLSEKDIDW